MFHAVVRTQIVDGLSPSVLLAGSQRELVDLFGQGFCFFIEMSISFSFLVVVVLVLFKLIKLMDFFETIIVFAVNGHIGRDCFVLGDSLEFGARVS